VVALRSVLATVAAVAIMVVRSPLDPAKAGGPNDPSFLIFTGTDLWRYGAFFYGGTLWTPAGVDADGFTLKMLLNGGGYTYTAGDLHADVDGTMLSASVLPGWRFTRNKLIVTVFAGPVVQDYRLTPNDPGSRLHGLYLGMQFAGDVWYQPTATTMAAINGTFTTVGPTGSLRLAFGYKLFEPAFIGPEIEEIWCGNFDEVQFGAHVTGLRTKALEWSASSGWTLTSDQRSGPYLRIGVLTRF
jgi:Cellulose biosynthesis protein BcsS